MISAEIFCCLINKENNSNDARCIFPDDAQFFFQADIKSEQMIHFPYFLTCDEKWWEMTRMNLTALQSLELQKHLRLKISHWLESELVSAATKWMFAHTAGCI